MRLSQLPGNKSDHIAVSIKNADTVAIPAGTPVVLNLNGTDDGVAVVLPSTKNDARVNQGARYGVTTRNMAVGDYGDAVVYGFTPTLVLIRQSRSATTVSWATMAAQSVGEYLSIDTVNNGFATVASTLKIVTNATTDTLALTINNPDAVIAQTLATAAGTASSTADARTAITVIVKAFVRQM